MVTVAARTKIATVVQVWRVGLDHHKIMLS